MKPVVCGLKNCIFVFFDLKSFAKHVYKDHKRLWFPESDLDTATVCNWKNCELKFHKSESYKKHCKKDHMSQIHLPKVVEPVEKKRYGKKRKNQKIRCIFCNAKFSRNFHLENHKLRYHLEQVKRAERAIRNHEAMERVKSNIKIEVL